MFSANYYIIFLNFILGIWYNKLSQNYYFFQRTGKTTACRFIFRESKELAAAFEKQSLRRTQTDFDSQLKTCAASPVLQTVLFNEIKIL